MSAGPGPGAQSASSQRGGEIAARSPQRRCGPCSPGGPARRRRRRRRGRIAARRPRPPTPPPAPPLPAAPHLEWKHGGAGLDLRRLSARPGADCAPLARPRPPARPRRPAPAVRAPAPAVAAVAAAAVATAARRPRRLCLQLPPAAHVSGLPGRPRDPGRALRAPPPPGPRQSLPAPGRGRWVRLPDCARGGGPKTRGRAAAVPALLAASRNFPAVPLIPPTPPPKRGRARSTSLGMGWGVPSLPADSPAAVPVRGEPEVG